MARLSPLNTAILATLPLLLAMPLSKAADLDPTAVEFVLPNKIKWVRNAAGTAEQAVLFGDPAKPGPYVLRLEWLPNNMSRPHSHSYDRYFAVISGTWWMGTGDKFEPENTVPVPAGTYVVHYGSKVHYDGAKNEEVVIQVWGMGPVSGVPPPPRNADAPAADGYNFYFGITAALTTNPLLFKTLPYDPAKDFVPVAFIARSPFAVLVRADSPISSFDDVVVRAKAAPGRLSLGNEGPRTFSGMIARLFNARSGARANLVPYASVSVGVQDLLGGHVNAMVADVASVAPHVAQGRLPMLATTSSARIAGWEQVPSLSETLTGLDMVGWFAVVAPTGTPAAAIGRFNKDLNELLAVKEMAQRIAAIGPLVEAGWSPDQVANFLRSESARWKQLAKEIGVLPE